MGPSVDDDDDGVLPLTGSECMGSSVDWFIHIAPCTTSITIELSSTGSLGCSERKN